MNSFFQRCPSSIAERWARSKLDEDMARHGLSGLLESRHGRGVSDPGPAIIADILVNSVLPAGSRNMLLWMSVSLIALAAIDALLRMLHGTALMRIEGRVSVSPPPRFGTVFSDCRHDLHANSWREICRHA